MPAESHILLLFKQKIQKPNVFPVSAIIYPKRGVTQYKTHLKHLSSMILLGNDLINSHELFE